MFPLYNIVADIPETEETIIATLADDRVILASDPSHLQSSIQMRVNKLQDWCHKWLVWLN